MQPATLELAFLSAFIAGAYFLGARFGRRWTVCRQFLETVLPFLMGLAGFTAFITGAVP